MNFKFSNKPTSTKAASDDDIVKPHKYHKLGVMAESRLFYNKLDHSEYNSKFALIDKDTILDETNADKQQKNIKNLSEVLLRKKWGLKKPKLLISVTGSAMNFQMKPNLRKVFRRGIAQAAKSTQAWILTGGTHAGVMKHVGDAMHEYSAWKNDDTAMNDQQDPMSQENFIDVPVIGFCTYETLTADTRKNIDYTMNPKNNNPVDGVVVRRVVEVPPDKKIGSTDRWALLDKNHTHFLLFSSHKNRTKIENEEDPVFGEEIKIWSLIENYIIKNWDRPGRFQHRNLDRACSMEKKKNTIPALLISIQGGPGTLDTILNHFKMNIPMVAIRSSGGWTDIICDLCGQYDNDFQEIGKSRVSTREPNAKIFEFTKKNENDCDQVISFNKIDNDADYKTSYKTIFESKSNPEKFSGTFTGKEAVYAVLIVEKLMQYNMANNRPIDLTHVKKAIEIYKKKELVTIFELNDNDDQLDTAMMQAVLSAQQNGANTENSETTKVKKIHLAIDYDKAELIHEELYNDDTPLELEQLGGIFDQAILFRKPKFINLLHSARKLQTDFRRDFSIFRN